MTRDPTDSHPSRRGSARPVKPSLWQRLFRRSARRADDELLQAAPDDDDDNEDGMPAAAPIGMASVLPMPQDSLRQALIHEVRALRANRRTAEAIFELESALLHRFPGDPDLHAELHAAYRKAGDPYATLAHGQQWVSALARKGHMRDALQALGELHAIDEDFKLTDGDAAVPLARLAMQDSARDLAVGLVDGFDQRFPGHPEMPVMYFLGARLLSEHWHKHEKAAQMIRSILAHFSNHPIAEEAKAYLVALDARIESGKGEKP